eukprot:4131106-Amphidinium_carterae.1
MGIARNVLTPSDLMICTSANTLGLLGWVDHWPTVCLISLYRNPPLRPTVPSGACTYTGCGRRPFKNSRNSLNTSKLGQAICQLPTFKK